MGIFDFFKKNKNIEDDNGLNEIYYDDGKGPIKSRFNMRNPIGKKGWKHGLYESWYRNGQLQSVKEYNMGDVVKSEFWDEYGNDTTERVKKEEEERQKCPSCGTFVIPSRVQHHINLTYTTHPRQELKNLKTSTAGSLPSIEVFKRMQELEEIIKVLDAETERHMLCQNCRDGRSLDRLLTTDISTKIDLPFGYQNIGLDRVYDGVEFLKANNGNLSQYIPLLFIGKGELQDHILIGVPTLVLAKDIIDEIIEKNGVTWNFEKLEPQEGWSCLYANKYFGIGYMTKHLCIRINLFHRLSSLDPSSKP